MEQRAIALADRLADPTAFDLARTLDGIGIGRHDPCARWLDGRFRLTARTPDGPGRLDLHRTGDTVHAAGYGPGAAWLLDRADAVVGLRDDLTGFDELARAHPLVQRLAREHRGLRLHATGLVMPRVLRAVCEQKVTGKEAYRAYSAIVRRFGAPAPGPDADGLLRLPPDPADLAAAPYWRFHPLGLEQRRADTVRRVAAEASALQRCPDSATLTRRLTALPGIGPWTAAEVTATVFGDPDAVSVGDYHLPNIVAWALAGEPRADDTRMLQLLAPFAGHRGRVCRLLAAAGIGAPRYGPRAPVRDFRRF